MEKRLIVQSQIAWSVVLTAGWLLEQGSQAALNVRDFGAQGDNVTDDTAAIRRALEAAQRVG